MKISLLIYIVAFSMLLGGCSSSKRVVVVPKTLPVWYQNPPQSSEGELYAVGEGRTKKQAIDNALSLLASTLSVSISSSFNAKTVVKEGLKNSSDATYINQTKSDVKKIRISDYVIVNATKLGFKRFAVLIKANKMKLFNGLKDEINQRFDIFVNKEKSIKSANALYQLSFYKRNRVVFHDIANILVVMKILNPEFNEKSYLKKLNAINEKYFYLLGHITFSLNAAPDATQFIKSVAKGLNAKGFKIENKKNKLHFTVFIKAQIKKAQAYGFSIARSEITLSTYDFKKNIVATNVLHLDGQSSQGYSIALQDLSKKFDSLIMKEGIENIILIDIY